MFFRKRTTVGISDKLIEKIKKDLTCTLEKKGVAVSEIRVDMQTDKLNLSLSIKEQN